MHRAPTSRCHGADRCNGLGRYNARLAAARTAREDTPELFIPSPGVCPD
jgi:hypothetical protein